MSTALLPSPNYPIQWTQPANAPLGPPRRVCDRCIRKKIKCDLQYPRCSACVEAGSECAYSHRRRRPGPPKGSRRWTRFQPTPSTDTGLSALAPDLERPINEPGCSIIQQGTIPARDGNVFSEVVGLGDSGPPFSGDQHLGLQSLAPILPEPSAAESLGHFCSQLHVEQRHELAQNFVTTINEAFPLFRSRVFLDQLSNGIIYNMLPSIIYAISSRLTSPPFPYGDVDIDAALGRLVNSATVEVDGVVDPEALNQWRTACLLSWYGFNQFPGKGEAVRIAILVRKAYQCGLHQIDNEENQSTFGWNCVSDGTLEDWRHVWWCLYFLDCYASFSTATPHQVETESLRTALLQDSLFSNDSRDSSEKLFLPSDRAGYWRIVQDIAKTNGDKAFNLHMAISSLLKEAVIAQRQHQQNPRGSIIRERMSALEDHLCAIQLALPPNYMRHMRDLVRGESSANHHYRLLAMLKIFSIRLLFLMPEGKLDEGQWQVRWQENLEICYRIFAVIQQWDTQNTLVIDPAVSFIGLSLLMLLHLHSLSSGIADPPLREQLDRRKNIVRLFLQHYATYWSLPRHLLGCYDALLRKVTKPLLPDDINRITKQFQGPLHEKWLDPLPLTSQQENHPAQYESAPAPMTDSTLVPVEENGRIDSAQPWEDFITLPPELMW